VTALWTVEQVAAYLMLKPSTVRSYCERGILPYVKLPAGLRFRLADIEAWVEGRTIRPRPRRNRPLTGSPHHNDIVVSHATAPKVQEG
jgi:excisionase family DNA binding protein